MYSMEYSKAKIYKIYNNVDDDFYVGSTCCNLSTRMAKHRYSAKNVYCKNRKLYPKMNEFGIENFFIVLLQDYPECQNIEQLRQKEREYIEKLKPTLNCSIPSRTHQEWIEKNHEHKKELDKQLYQKNREERFKYQKQYAKENPEKVKEYKRNCYEKNKDKYNNNAKQIVQCEVCGKEMQKKSMWKHRKQHS